MSKTSSTVTVVSLSNAMAERSLSELNSASYGGSADNSAACNTEAGLTNVTLSGLPEVEVKRNSEATRSPSVVRGVKDMTPEEVQALNEKIRKESAKKYFALRPDAFNNAVEECKCHLEESDGKFLSSWLLTEIDHWDHEKEKVVMLTEKMLVLARYNFIGLRCDEVFKIPLIKCDRIQSGRFNYPKNTMMIPRHFQYGVRVCFSKNTQPSFLDNWNPWSHCIPFVTIGLHKGYQFLNEMPAYMQLDVFEQELISAITNAHNSLQEGVAEQSLEVVRNQPILIKVYCGFSPILHNWSILGYSRDRGYFGY